MEKASTEMILTELLRMNAKIDQLAEKTDAGFGAVEKRFAQVDRRFDAIDQRFAQVDRRFDAMDQRFTEMDQRFDGLEKDLKIVYKQTASNSEDIFALKTAQGPTH